MIAIGPLEPQLKQFLQWLVGEIRKPELEGTRERKEMVGHRILANHFRIDAGRFDAEVEEGGIVIITGNLARRLVDEESTVPMSDPTNEYFTIRPSPAVAKAVKKTDIISDPVANLALFMDQKYPHDPQLGTAFMSFANRLLDRINFLDEHSPKRGYQVD